MREPLPKLVRTEFPYRLRPEETVITLHVEESMLVCGLKAAWEEAMLLANNPNFNSLSRCPVFAELSAHLFASSGFRLFVDRDNPNAPVSNDASISFIAGTQNVVTLWFLTRLRAGYLPCTIYVLASNCRRMELGVQPFTTTGYVKHLIQEKLGIPAGEQQLTYSGLAAQDDCTLAHYGLQQEATLRLA